MATKKKESVLKPVGRFIANELLGVDDARRAGAKLRKGDVKGAVKSAAAGILEAGTTFTGVGLGAKVGVKIGLKAGKSAMTNSAKRVSDAAGEITSRKIPRPSLGGAGSVRKNVRANPLFPAVVKKATNSASKKTSSSVIVSSPKKVSYTTPPRTLKAQEGTQRGREKIRTRAINDVRSTAYESSISTSRAPARGRATGAALGAGTGLTTVAATKRVDKKTVKPKKTTK